MWDNAVAQAKAARDDRAREHGEGARGARTPNSPKPEPDFAAVATVADAAQANNQALRKQVRDEWLELYATFTPAQKAVVRDAVKARRRPDGGVPREDEGAHAVEVTQRLTVPSPVAAQSYSAA